MIILMTSITIAYNQKWIALAADSAGNVKWKVFWSNKIYRISKKWKVWVAVYGLSHFWDMPFELIAKLFKESHTDLCTTLEEYKDRFLEFISQYNETNTTAVDIINNHYWFLMKELDDSVEHVIGLIDDIENQEKIIKIAKELLLSKYQAVCKNHYMQEEHANEIIEVFESLDEDYFKYNELDYSMKPYLQELLKYTLVMHVLDPVSWIVFFWYWEDEIYPQLISLNVYSRYGSYIYKNEDEEKCSVHWTEYQNQWVYTYAISDCIESILFWISWSMYKNIKDDDRTSPALLEYIDELKQNQYQSFKNYTNYLSLNELTSMVETLVSLEGFKTRMTSMVEDVWWPTDVAVISKWDWFIRTKRKHYFKRELNEHFFTNYQ